MSDFDPDYWGARIRAAAHVVPKGEAVMGEKMSLQQVRDAMLEEKAWARGTGWPMAAGTLQRWANAIDAHLTQPAQAVDVGAIREVIEELRAEQKPLDPAFRLWADKLARALGNAQAEGRRVPDGWRLVPVDSTTEMDRAARMWMDRDTHPSNVWDAMINAAPLPNANGKEDTDAAR